MTLSDEEINPSDVNSTQAVDIFAFVGAEEIPFIYFETPYYLAPAPGDEKGYAVLRETLSRTRKIGIAYVVIQARQHLAALIPCGPVLMLNTLRCGNDACSLDEPGLAGDSVKTVKVTEQELDTAAEIVESMTQKWDVSLYGDGFDVWEEESDGEQIGCGSLAEILQPGAHHVEDRRLYRSRTPHRAQWSSRPRVRSRRTLH